MSGKSFVVVGAGLGGVATALRLAHRGHSVTVLEKNDQVGGRNRELKVGECTFDAGPTLMMMLDPFERLFRDVGERLEDHLDISLCDPHYRVMFNDGTRVDATPNVAKMIRQIEAIAGPKDAASYPAMMGDLSRLFHASMPKFVERNYNSFLDLVRPESLSIALRHRMLGNLSNGIARYLDDPKMRVLFCLQTMYLGLSPHDAPFVYAVLAYMEYGEGIWYPKGGMIEICRSVARLAQKKGVEIRLNSRVERIEGKTAFLASGERVSGDAIVINADLPYAERALLGSVPEKTRAKRAKRRYSCSAYNMYLDYKGSVPELLHHNIVLGADFDGNLDQIFNRFEIPSDPAFYLAASSKTDPVKAAEGHENLYILVPCPNLTHPFSESDGCTLQERVFDRLEKETSFDRSQIQEMRTVSPHDWANDLNLDRGAAFGLSHDLFQSVCFRPSNRCSTNPDVYFVGASTVPGNGLPMVLISAELLEKRLQEDRRI